MRDQRMWLSRGLVSGAAGTTALYAATYVDMAVRGRPESDTPKQSVQRLSEVLHVPLPGNEESRDARATGIGGALGQSVGLTIGLVLGGLRALGWPRSRAGRIGVGWALAMTMGNGPMTVLGVTDPRAWTRPEWLSDALPHLAYAVAATAALDAFDR
jgi:hypothetical protein